MLITYFCGIFLNFYFIASARKELSKHSKPRLDHCTDVSFASICRLKSFARAQSSERNIFFGFPVARLQTVKVYILPDAGRDCDYGFRINYWAVALFRKTFANRSSSF
uniref:Secreted protein n=1 Tax=Anopheles maculatus TaxID=74869 RepID=A0A182SS45_9DIPT